jgi:DNA (cytosine-5)-methyltransferase 1
MTLKVLDLFACEGGAGAGYVRAGLALVASVDIDGRALSRNPNPGMKLISSWEEGLEEYAEQVDFIHASPPCQAYSVSTKRESRANWPDLVAPVRAALTATGKPFVIENVEGAPLLNPVKLRGCMFGLTTEWNVPKQKVRESPDGFAMWEVISGKKWITSSRMYDDVMSEGPVLFHLERVRGFEVNGFPLTAPLVDKEVHKLPSVTVIHGTPTGFWNQWYASVVPTSVKKDIMDTPWMSGNGVAESIPPAYTSYIGKQLLDSHLQGA